MIETFWSDEDGEFVARIQGHPTLRLSGLGKTRVAALTELVTALVLAYESAQGTDSRNALNVTVETIDLIQKHQAQLDLSRDYIATARRMLAQAEKRRQAADSAAMVYFAALMDIREGAEQQSQSHVDVMVKIDQALDKARAFTTKLQDAARGRGEGE